MIAYGEKIVSDEIRARALEGAKEYSRRAATDPTMKLKYAQGWINAERWTDAPAAPQPPQQTIYKQVRIDSEGNFID